MFLMTNTVTIYFKQAYHPLFKHSCGCNLRISNCENGIVTMQQQRLINPTLPKGTVRLQFAFEPSTPQCAKLRKFKGNRATYVATPLRLPTGQYLYRRSEHYEVTKSRRYFDRFHWLCNIPRTSFFIQHHVTNRWTKQRKKSAISALQMKAPRTPFVGKPSFLEVELCKYQGHHVLDNWEFIITGSM
jgi:hypothetical protein